MTKKLKALLIAVACLMLSCCFFACSSVNTTTLTLSQTSVVMKVGEKVTIDANSSRGGDATWTTDNGEVVMVKNGVITAIGEGIANVTATADGVSATLTVTVRAMDSFIVSCDGVTQTVLAGKTAVKPNPAPVKASDKKNIYEFDGWYVKGTDTKWDFNAPVNEDVVLESRFTATAIEYNVIMDGAIVATANYGDKIAKPAAPVKEADAQYTYTFDKWVIAGTDTEWDFSRNTVEGEVSLTPVFISNVRTYTVKAGSTVSYVKYGEKATAPVAPTKDKDAQYTYTFDKWVIAGTDTAWNFASDVVTGDVTLEATFKATEREYAIVIDPANGVAATNLKAKYGDKITKPADPVKASTASSQYAFIGWYVAGTGTVWNFDNELNDDLTLVARYVESARNYTVKLVDGDNISEIVVTYGSYVALPNLTKEDEESVYIFNGWYNGNAKFNASLTAITADVTLTANWTAQPKYYTVSFYEESGAFINSVNVKGGATVTAPGATPVKNQTVSTVYTFAGWNTADGTAYDFGAGVVSDVKLYASFTASARKYNVTLMNGDEVFATVKVAYDTNFSYDPNAEIPVYDAVGMYFVAWGEQGANAGYTGKVLADMTLYAITGIDNNTYTVTFKVEGSEDKVIDGLYRNDEVSYGVVTAPATENALATVNKFLGWKLEGTDTVYEPDDTIRCPENGATFVAIFEEVDIIYNISAVLTCDEYTLVDENGEAITKADLAKKYGEVFKFKVQFNSNETYGTATVKAGSTTLPAANGVYTLTVIGNQNVVVSGLALREYTITGSVTPMKQTAATWANLINTVDDAIVALTNGDEVAYYDIDANGDYEISGLLAGNYTVQFVRNVSGKYELISNDALDFNLSYALDNAGYDENVAEGKITVTAQDGYVGYVPYTMLEGVGAKWSVHLPNVSDNGGVAVLRGAADPAQPSKGNAMIAFDASDVGSKDFVATVKFDQYASEKSIVENSAADTEPSIGLAFHNGEQRVGIVFYNYGGFRVFVSNKLDKGFAYGTNYGAGQELYLGKKYPLLTTAGSLLGKYGDCYRDVELTYARSGEWLHIFITAKSNGTTSVKVRENMCTLSVNLTDGTIYTKESYKTKDVLTGTSYSFGADYDEPTNGANYTAKEGEVFTGAIKNVFTNVQGIQVYHGTGMYSGANIFGWNYTTDADIVAKYAELGAGAGLGYKNTYTVKATVGGDALADTTVTFTHKDTGVETVYATDANGNFTANVAPGEYVVNYAHAKALNKKVALTVVKGENIPTVDLDYGFRGTSFQYTNDAHTEAGTYNTAADPVVSVTHDEYAENSIGTVAIYQDKVENHIVWGQPLAEKSVWGFTMTLPEKMYYNDFDSGSAWYCDIYWKWQVGGVTPAETIRAGFTRYGNVWGDLTAGSENIENFFKRTDASYSTAIHGGANWLPKYFAGAEIKVDVMYVRQGASLAMYARYSGTTEWGLVGTSTKLTATGDVLMDIRTAGHPTYADIAGCIVYDNFYYQEGTVAIADATANIVIDSAIANATVTSKIIDEKNGFDSATLTAKADKGYITAITLNGNVVSAFGEDVSYTFNAVAYGTYNVSAISYRKSDLKSITGNVTIDFGIEYGNTATMAKTYTTKSGKVVATNERGFSYEGKVVDGVYTVYVPVGEYDVQVFSAAITVNGKTVNAYRSDVATVSVTDTTSKNMVVNTPTEDYYYEMDLSASGSNIGKGASRYNNGFTVMKDGSLYPIASGVTESYVNGFTFVPNKQIVEFGYRAYGNFSSAKYHWLGSIVKSADQKRLIRINAIANGGNYFGFTAVNPDSNADKSQAVTGNGRLTYKPDGTNTVVAPFGYTSTVTNAFTNTANSWANIYFKYVIDGYKVSVYVKGTNYLPVSGARNTNWDSTKDAKAQADGWVPYVVNVDMQAYTKDYKVFNDTTYGIYHLDEVCYIGAWARFDGNSGLGNKDVYRGMAQIDNVWVNVIER